jgi:hypothetical protein
MPDALHTTLSRLAEQKRLVPIVQSDLYYIAHHMLTSYPGTHLRPPEDHQSCLGQYSRSVSSVSVCRLWIMVLRHFPSLRLVEGWSLCGRNLLIAVLVELLNGGTKAKNDGKLNMSVVLLHG